MPVFTRFRRPPQTTTGTTETPRAERSAPPPAAEPSGTGEPTDTAEASGATETVGATEASGATGTAAAPDTGGTPHTAASPTTAAPPTGTPTPDTAAPPNTQSTPHTTPPPTGTPTPGTAGAPATTAARATGGAPGTGDPASTTEPHEPAPAAGEFRTRLARSRVRHPTAVRNLRRAAVALAVLLVYVCLQMPSTLGQLRLREFVRFPVEAVIGAAVLLSLPRRPRLLLAAAGGAVLGALAVLNMVDMGFSEYLGRHFNIVLDWGLLDDARSYLEDALGGPATLALTAGVVVFVLLLIALVALSVVRLAELLARHRGAATRGTLIAGTVWMTCAAFGLQVAGVPLASDHTAGVLKVQARTVRDTLRDEAAFGREARADTFGATPADQLVPDLRGKDVLFTFIESYGRSAIEDPVTARGVGRTLDTSTKALAKAGFHARSGWLTSATYGGSSWLGHSTTMSGLWVDNQQRYRTVMASDHLSLTKAFRKTGAWDTVGVMPGVQKSWPEQEFYGLDKVYNAFQLGYEGPKFSWSTMPDQYALEAFQRQVHGRKRDKPLMAEIILTSSHQPWAPIPRMVGWDELGDGSVFRAIQKAGNKPADLLTDTTRSRQEYGKSIQYSVTSLTQWLERYGTDDTVLVFLGDHQPIARVSGAKASRDVPVSIVARDPEVLDRIAGWNWTEGLRPDRAAPVWRMSSFRDRFLKAYGSTPHPSGG